MPSIINERYEQMCAPFRRLYRNKQKLNCEFWISKKIYSLIRCKTQMYKSHKIRGDIAMKLDYKKFAINLTKMKTLAKKAALCKSARKEQRKQSKKVESSSHVAFRKMTLF